MSVWKASDGGHRPTVVFARHTFPLSIASSSQHLQPPCRQRHHPLLASTSLARAYVPTPLRSPARLPSAPSARTRLTYAALSLPHRDCPSSLCASRTPSSVETDRSTVRKVRFLLVSYRLPLIVSARLSCGDLPLEPKPFQLPDKESAAVLRVQVVNGSGLIGMDKGGTTSDPSVFLSPSALRKLEVLTLVPSLCRFAPGSSRCPSLRIASRPRSSSVRLSPSSRPLARRSTSPSTGRRLADSQRLSASLGTRLVPSFRHARLLCAQTLDVRRVCQADKRRIFCSVGSVEEGVPRRGCCAGRRLVSGGEGAGVESYARREYLYRPIDHLTTSADTQVPLICNRP